MQPEPIKTWQNAATTLDPIGQKQFEQTFRKNFEQCAWAPHPLYSVFTQYDQDWYLSHESAFQNKYRSFYAVAKAIAPKSIIELGTCAGASADAYLSAARDASYLGLDVFGVNFRQDNNEQWDPFKIAEELFTARDFKNWQLIRGDLRLLQQLPAHAELVVVDAAHDFENEYADLKLALTATPRFIFVDDSDDENGAKPAIEKFLADDLRGQVDFTFSVDYVGGGLVIKLAHD